MKYGPAIAASFSIELTGEDPVTNNQNLLIAALLLSLGSVLAGCSNALQTSSSDQASTMPAATTSYSSKPYQSCNQASSPSSTMTVKIQSYIESNTRHDDLMSLKFSSLNESFSDNTHFIQMWRWMASNTSAPSIDPTPVNFRLELISTGEILKDYMSSMKWSDISALASNRGFTTVASFFAAVRLTADTRDTTASYQVLKIAYYKTSDNSVDDQVDLLMPIFAMNPADYALQPNGQTRPTVLQNLHPFKAYTSSTVAQLTSMVQSFCF